MGNQYHQRRAQGKCGQAGCAEMSTRSYCDKHMTYYVALNQLKRKRMREARRCVACSEPLLPQTTTVTCHECLEYNRLRRNNARNEILETK